MIPCTLSVRFTQLWSKHSQFREQFILKPQENISLEVEFFAISLSLSCMVQFDLFPFPSGNPWDKSSPSGPEVGNCLKRSCPGARGVGVKQIKNISSLILRSTCHFSRGIHDGCGPQHYVIFMEKRRNLSESGWRGITYQKLSLKVCFKIWN